MRNPGRVAVSSTVTAGAIMALLLPIPGFDLYQRAGNEFISSIVFWVLMGVLSSVGLGSGLHTFLLYTGPHIIRVATAAVACNSLEFSARIRTYGIELQYDEDAFDCPPGDPESRAPVPLLGIVGKVWLVCFLWGFGTALGELPPYFVARTAAEAGRRVSEIREVEEAEAEEASLAQSRSADPGNTTVSSTNGLHAGASPSERAKAQPNQSCCSSAFGPVGALVHYSADRMKQLVYDGIKKYGFWAVLLAASVPNPFFDLAGLTCGHCGVPLLTFFVATVIGKAVIKVSMQAASYAILFSPAALEAMRSVMEPIAPGVSHGIAFVEGQLMKKQVQVCTNPAVDSVLVGESARQALVGGTARLLAEYSMESSRAGGAAEALGVLPAVGSEPTEQRDGSSVPVQSSWAAPSLAVALPDDSLQKCETCCHDHFNARGESACIASCLDVGDSQEVRLEVTKALAGLDDDGFVGTAHHYWMYMRSMSAVDWLKTGWMAFVCGMVGWFVLTAVLAVAQERASRLDQQLPGQAVGASHRRPKLKISGRLPHDRRLSGASAHDMGGDTEGGDEEGGFSPEDPVVDGAGIAAGGARRSVSRPRGRWPPPDATPTRAPMMSPTASDSSEGTRLRLGDMPGYAEIGRQEDALPESPVQGVGGGGAVGHSMRQRSLQERLD